MIATLEGMEDRLLSKLTAQLESTVMSFSQGKHQPEGTPPNTYARSGPRRGKPTRHQFEHSYKESRPYVHQLPRNNTFHGQYDSYPVNRMPLQMPNPQRPPMQPMQPQPRGSAPRYNTPAGPRKCFNCGYDDCFSKFNCRAFSHICNICYKQGHFESVCSKNPYSPFLQRFSESR